MGRDQHELAAQVGEAMFELDRATREFMRIELVSCDGSVPAERRS